MSEKLSEMLGLDFEAVKKSENILPSFDLGALGVGDKVICQAIDAPKMVTFKDRETKKDKSVPVLAVNVVKVIRADGIEIPYNEKYGLWLSSKTLSMGLNRLVKDDNVEGLLGKRFMIKVGMAEYKNYGEGRCYHVNSL